MNRARRSAIIILASAVLLSLGFPPAASARGERAAPEGQRCRARDVPVLRPNTTFTMHGELCVPRGPRPSTVWVLVPGGTYNQEYWDFSYEPNTYNFRLAMNEAGDATMTLDRLGTGGSSRPPSVVLSADAQARAVHEVIQALRSGRLGPRFDRVILGGHSVGSSITILEAGTYRDVDGVLITGLTHRLHMPELLRLFTEDFHTANQDEKFAGEGYDPGYLTTKPGHRYRAFHRPGETDPRVVATDEATKDVFTATEGADAIGLGAVSPYSARIRAPVMLVMGQLDPYLCPPVDNPCSDAESLRRAEAPSYPSASSFDTFVVDGYGHSLNLAPNAPAYHRAVLDWADAHVGSGRSVPVPGPR